jgi:hypothetical protein
MKNNGVVVLHGFQNNNMLQIQLCGFIVCNVIISMKGKKT